MITALLLLPFFCIGLYRIAPQLKQYLAIGDLLLYYGTAFSIAASIAIFFVEQMKEKNRKLQREREVCPEIAVMLRRKEKTDVFIVTIKNLSANVLKQFYFFDRYIGEYLKDACSFTCCFDKTTEEAKQSGADHNIVERGDFIDENGYPNSLNVSGTDRDGNHRNYVFNKVKDADNVYYFKIESEVV